MPLPAGWRFKYCVFDVEGVLLNARILAKKTFGRFLEREYGIPAAAALIFYTQAQDLTLREKFRRLLDDHGQPSPDLDAVVARFDEALESERPVVYEGAREVLDALLEKGAQLFAVGSSPVEQIKARLDRVDLLPKFREVVGQEAGSKGYSQSPGRNLFQRQPRRGRGGKPRGHGCGRGCPSGFRPDSARERSPRGLKVHRPAHLCLSFLRSS
ncbi:MAG: HAD hydrolase-like protein [Candidatus Tectomicrobia bacterium]|uniref:HAD hydrolase-like protein n=1 Tax=Tectimicrobiota bacterium TaxID=2528274 RepID=A0A932GQ51_UNCTE|nr:HAD hydrolase-like protein [Candidatus Tectomicrobia bacterium]